LNQRPHEDAEQGEDWVVFNSDGAISPSTEMTACIFFNATRFISVLDYYASCFRSEIGAFRFPGVGLLGGFQGAILRVLPQFFRDPCGLVKASMYEFSISYCANRRRPIMYAQGQGGHSELLKRASAVHPAAALSPTAGER
jgi:hypothetical protein